MTTEKNRREWVVMFKDKADPRGFETGRILAAFQLTMPQDRAHKLGLKSPLIVSAYPAFPLIRFVGETRAKLTADFLTGAGKEFDYMPAEVIPGTIEFVSGIPRGGVNVTVPVKFEK